MSRRRVNLVAAILALAIAMPLAARASAGNAKTTSTTLDILTDVSLHGTQIKAGTYTVSADDTKVTLMRNNKVVAEAPVQWKEETSKPHNSNILTVGDQLKEIHFGGKMRYVEIAD